MFPDIHENFHVIFQVESYWDSTNVPKVPLLGRIPLLSEICLAFKDLITFIQNIGFESN